MTTNPAVEAVAKVILATQHERVHRAEQEMVEEWATDLAETVVAAVRPIVIRECAEAIEDHCNKYFSQDEPGDFMAAADFVRGLAGEAT